MATSNTPASKLEIPKFFGRRPDARPLPTSNPSDIALTQAAMIHHRAALVVLDELTRRDLSIAWLAGELGENTDQVRRKLYGQVRASLRDLCAWGGVLNVVTVSAAPEVVAQ
jgi:hypothetical protein